MTKYVARLNGQIIGKRTTKSRSYTHAIVVQRDVEIARKRAYDYQRTMSDRKNYEYDVVIAEGKSLYDWNRTEKAIAEAKARVEGGFGGYMARVKAEAIERFETSLKAGNFEPFVAGWAGSLGLAHKAVSQHTGPVCHLVAIVPAEAA